MGLAFQAMQLADAMGVPERGNHADRGWGLEAFGRAHRATGPECREARRLLESEFATERNA